MSANLIIFSDYYLNFDNEIKFTLIRNFTGIGLQFTSINIVNFEIEPQELLSLFKENTIIAVPFDNEGVLQKIRLATDVYFDGKYVKQDFGYVSTKGDRHCCIVDTTLNNLDATFDYENLKKIFNAVNTFCVKIFGISKNEVLNAIKPLLNSEKYDYSYYSEFGDLLFCFINNKTEQHLFENFKRDFYAKLGDYIYIDEPLMLKQSLIDLLQIRKMRFTILDNCTNNYINSVFCENPILNSYYIKIDETNISLNLKSILTSFNLDFLVLITNTEQGICVSFINEIGEQQAYFKEQLNNYISMQKFCNFVFYEILKKIH